VAVAASVLAIMGVTAGFWSTQDTHLPTELAQGDDGQQDVLPPVTTPENRPELAQLTTGTECCSPSTSPGEPRKMLDYNQHRKTAAEEIARLEETSVPGGIHSLRPIVEGPYPAPVPAVPLPSIPPPPAPPGPEIPRPQGTPVAVSPYPPVLTSPSSPANVAKGGPTLYASPVEKPVDPVALVGIVPTSSQPPSPDISTVTQTYTTRLDNSFFRVDRAPVSSFESTVDTTSYSNVRRMLLQEHRLPPQETVQVAELINHFPYEYAEPKGEHPVALTLDLAQCPWNPRHSLARIGVKGKKYHPEQLPPRNFVFLCDTSASMDAPNRLPLLKKSLGLLVDQLGKNDRVALVTYAGGAGLALPPTPGTEKAKIRQAIDNLSAGGQAGQSSDGSAITLAYKVAEKHLQKDGLNRVILGTNGDLNVGAPSQVELMQLVEEKQKAGVCLSVVGFGRGNQKDVAMENLASHGNGHYAYIDSEAEARKVFVEQGAALATIAKDVNLQVEFNPRRVAGYRLIGYETQPMTGQESNTDKTAAGSIGCGHTVTALYELVPASPLMTGSGNQPLTSFEYPVKTTAAAGGEWLTVKLRYKDPEGGKSKILAQPLKGEPVKFSEAPADFRFAAAVASFGMELRKTDQRTPSNLATVRSMALQAASDDPNGDRAEFLKIIDAASKAAPNK
jgi:Ca-activated chloride channel family protein